MMVLSVPMCRSLTQMGTEKEDFVQLTERIGRKTGGLSFSPFTSHKRGEIEPVSFLMVRGKVTASKAPDMLDLMRDILLTARLDDKERFKQVCLLVWTMIEHKLASSCDDMVC